MSNFGAYRGLLAGQFKSARQRWTRKLAIITMIVSFEFFIVKNLKLNQLYCVKRRPSSVLFVGKPTTTTTTTTTTTADSQTGHPVKTPKEDASSHQDDGHLASSGSRLPDIDKYLRYYYTFSLYYCLWNLMKYVCICSLEFDYLREYRYVDCYLIGRFLVNGRLGSSINYYGVWGLTFMCLWRWLMIRSSRRAYKLYCFEFLLYTPNELQEAQSDGGQESANSILQRRDVLVIQQANSEPPGGGGLFALQYPQRLNRTIKQWELLSQTITKQWLYSMLALAMVVPLFLLMVIPLLLTRKGFEVTYTGCSSWISDNNASDYYHIYSPYEGDPSIKPSFFLPMRHFNPQNAYHILRTGADFVFSLMAYFDAMTAFLSAACIGVLLSEDVCCYAAELRPRLQQLIESLRARYVNVLPASRADSQLELQTRILQSTLMDFFSLVQSYSKFASLLTIFIITAWMCYSALVAKWIFTPGGERPKVEWYVLHVFTTFYVLLVIGGFSRVRVACRRLYPLIGTAACLDRSYGRERERWLIIFDYFWPRPLYCFAMFGSVELSWLFLLELFTSLLSSFVVASSFFTFSTL